MVAVGVVLKRFEATDEARQLDHGKFELVHLAICPPTAVAVSYLSMKSWYSTNASTPGWHAWRSQIHSSTLSLGRSAGKSSAKRRRSD